eukprot:2870091-Prymnesium_polylepis.1
MHVPCDTCVRVARAQAPSPAASLTTTASPSPRCSPPAALSTFSTSTWATSTPTIGSRRTSRRCTALSRRSWSWSREAARTPSHPRHARTHT